MVTGARRSVSESVARIHALGVVPVIELEDVLDAEPLLAALTDAGLPAAEITLRTPAGLKALNLLSRLHPDAFLGAGTVLTVSDARQAISAGARFLVSPTTNLAVIKVCSSADVLMIPGACTPTEVHAAVHAGAPLVKFFPAEAIGGLPFLKALVGPFPDVAFVPTGVINTSNLADYLRLPQVAACGGSWMVAPALLRARRFDRIASLTREASRIVTEVRAER
jgi:2-dehydro-3-deoxyphosphogluconate aldolase/(4S)-4-hydroxy-2-oxoglutarate aldolase